MGFIYRFLLQVLSIALGPQRDKYIFYPVRIHKEEYDNILSDLCSFVLNALSQEWLTVGLCSQ